jgi:hypothetical protein
MKSSLDKFWVVPLGLCNTSIPSRLFSGLGHGRALTGLRSTSCSESIGTGARGRCFRGLGWLRPRRSISSIMAQGGIGWRSRGTLGTSRVWYTLSARGLRRFRCGFLSSRAWGLVHLWGLATDWGTLHSRVWVDILGHSK